MDIVKEGIHVQPDYILMVNNVSHVHPIVQIVFQKMSVKNVLMVSTLKNCSFMDKKHHSVHKSVVMGKDSN